MTNLDEISSSLIKDINSASQLLLQPNGDEDNSNETAVPVKESTRQALIQAAEKLVIAARMPHEKLYNTATNV